MNSKENNPSSGFLLLLSFVEMWERFSYYGMRALLVLYLTTQLGLLDEQAYSIYALFSSVGYLGCVIFGYIADKYFSPRYMLILGGMIMMLGYAFMTFAYLDQNFIYDGISLIAIGTSAFKGNITNILGICYKKLNKLEEQDAGYTLFYVGINLGAFLASIICGTVGMKYNWYWGFGIAGVGMAIGLITFLALSHKVLGDAGENSNRLSLQKHFILFVGLSLYALCVIYAIKNASQAIGYIKYIGALVLAYYAYLIYSTEARYRINLYILFLLMFFYVVFYALEMQTGALITVFASRNVNLTLGSYEIAAASVDSINPLTVITSGLIIGAILKDKSKSGYRARLFLGLLCIPASFAIFYIGTLCAVNSIVPFGYLFSGMILMALGEVFIGPVIQAKTSMLAPKDKRGVMFGMLMFAASYANIVGNFAANYMSVQAIDGVIDKAISLAVYQTGFIAVMKFTGLAALLFLIVSPFLNKAVAIE